MLDPTAGAHWLHNHSPRRALFLYPLGGGHTIAWPPKGLHVIVYFAAPNGWPSALVWVPYEIYDGMVPVVNNSPTNKSVVVDTITTELLRAFNWAPD